MPDPNENQSAQPHQNDPGPIDGATTGDYQPRANVPSEAVASHTPSPEELERLGAKTPEQPIQKPEELGGESVQSELSAYGKTVWRGSRTAVREVKAPPPRALMYCIWEYSIYAQKWVDVTANQGRSMNFDEIVERASKRDDEIRDLLKLAEKPEPLA